MHAQRFLKLVTEAKNNVQETDVPSVWKRMEAKNELLIIDGETVILEAGQSIKIKKNTRVQYSNPFVEPCEYFAVCLPAFSIDSVNREE